MNYSILPEEMLVPESDDSDFNNKIEIEIKGLVMEVDLNTGKLTRIISSNPEAYLLYQPGLKIDFIPQIN